MIEIFKKLVGDKKAYRQTVARIKALPPDYRYVFDKIQKYMWHFAAGNGYDMVKIHDDLIDLFEAGAVNGKHVLEITGDDVAAFCDGLLENAKTYTAQWRESLNHDIHQKLDSSKDSPPQL